jgi:hypothetical protein
VSHAGAWNILQDAAEQVAVQEEKMAQYNENGCLQGEIDAKVLFEEMDGVWLSMQGKDRPKKIGKCEIKIATHYSGWEEITKDRYETVGKVAYAGFDEPKEFHRRREGQVAQWYDTDEIEVRIVNGDGASWIRGIDEDAIMQLDPFHKSRSILRGLKDKKDRVNVNKLLGENDVEGALDYIKVLKLSAQDETERERIAKLYEYLNGNKHILLTWDMRGIELPTPPAGIIYRRLGTEEHSNCDILTHRMKRRKASWSKKGGSNMAKLLCRRTTLKSMKRVGDVKITDAVYELLPPLSASQAPKYDGIGDSGGIAHGGWPFEGAFVTEGRKAIRGIFHIKGV